MNIIPFFFLALMVILYPAHSSVLVRATWSVFCLFACLSGLHFTTLVCPCVCLPSTPLSASRLQCSHFAATHTTLKHPPHPHLQPPGLSLSHFTPLGALSTSHTSCSVLVGGIEKSILFRCVPCMLLLARWFSHPAVTPPSPQGLPWCAQLSLKTLPCRHGSLGSPC